MSKGILVGCGVVVLGAVLLLAVAGMGSYNSLVGARRERQERVGPGRERVPAAQRPHSQPGRDREGRRRVRARHLHRGDRGARQGGPGDDVGRARERGAAPAVPGRRRTSSPPRCRDCWSWSSGTPSSRPPKRSATCSHSSRAPRTASPSSACASTKSRASTTPRAGVSRRSSSHRSWASTRGRTSRPSRVRISRRRSSSERASSTPPVSRSQPFSDADLDAIRAAVDAAERKSAGEIVTVDRRALRLLPGRALEGRGARRDGGDPGRRRRPWRARLLGRLDLAVARAAGVGGRRHRLPAAAPGAAAPSRAGSAPTCSTARVERRAHAAFAESEVFATRARTGLLLLVALFEHRVEIVCDRGVEERVPTSGVGADRRSTDRGPAPGSQPRSRSWPRSARSAACSSRAV